jgi:PTS system mannose-specific IIA component
MIGLIIITHGNLGQEMLAALEHVLGPQKNAKAVAIGPHDDMEERRQLLIQEVKAVEGGQGVVIFTDMFGGTPSNLAISLLQEKGIEVIAGVNLPMLIKFSSLRQSEPLSKVITEAQEAGRKYINVASKLLAANG